MFQGLGRFRGQRFSVRFPLEESEGLADWDWNRVRQRGHEYRLMGYKIQTCEVSGDFSDIIDLFVRINSTGKRLSSAERRDAKYYHSEFLKQAGRLAESRRRFFEENRILSKGQLSRMKHVELVCELLASIHAMAPINKKKALDALIAGHTVDRRSLKRCLQQFTRTLNLIRKVFPNLRTTRFTRVSDFYSLFMFVWESDRAGRILTDGRRNRQAQRLLVWLSDGVGVVREQVKKAEGAKADQRMFADDLLTVQGDTDSLPTRKRRADLLQQMFGGLFERKDGLRGFTQEQRRLIWHSDEKRKCKRCGDSLSWENFTIDHIKPHSLCGRTQLNNAALLCRRCNSRKGNRR